MSGADIVGALLRSDAAVTSIVRAQDIKGGRLPDDAAIPSLLVRSISGTDRQTLRRGSYVRVTERIAVLVRAGSYRQQGQIIDLVRKCCAGRTGDLGGAKRVSILTAGHGPDVNGPANTFEKTQDFSVSYDELA